MDIRMSSLPGGGLLGSGGGGGGHFVGKNTKCPVVCPQVTLNMNVNPPILDTTALKSSPKSTATLCGATTKVWWSSIRNMLCSGTPVTWINPDMVPQFHPQAMSQPLYSEAQYPMVDTLSGNRNPPLWYQATPGCQFDYQEPHSFYDTQPPAYPTKFISSFKNEIQKVTQPLNPEAKEWVPSNFKKDKSSLPKCSLISPDDVQKPLLIENVSVGLIEITDSKIEEVRKNIKNELPKKTQDPKITEDCSNKQKTSCDAKMDNMRIVNDRLMESCKVISNSNKYITNCNITNVRELEGTLAKQRKDSRNYSSSEEYDHLNFSYASIARRSEPSPQIKDEIRLENEHYSPSESIKQPLPKIFLKDKKYPKEKAPTSVENKNRDPLPFRTASKSQKKRSKVFLRDLKEQSPVKSDSSFTGSESSFESTNSEIMSRLCVGSSPASLRLPLSISPREQNVGVCSISPTNLKPHNMSESSTSSSHIRTTSESSTGSVESVDIQFSYEWDMGDDKLENICFIMDSSPSEKPHESNCVLTDACQSKSSKHPNDILAHILGLDSESEDSDDDDDDDDDDDSDWDDVNECDSLVLDDSWETFGLNVPSITKSSFSKSGNGDNLNSENICDNDYYNNSLEDINKHWDEEVKKDVLTASPSRVTFGGVRVYPMVMWSFAYKNARRGPWEQHARDRVRFSNHISALEPILSPVLKAAHRKSMYYKIYGS